MFKIAWYLAVGRNPDRPLPLVYSIHFGGQSTRIHCFDPLRYASASTLIGDKRFSCHSGHCPDGTQTVFDLWVTQIGGRSDGGQWGFRRWPEPTYMFGSGPERLFLC